LHHKHFLLRYFQSTFAAVLVAAVLVAAVLVAAALAELSDISRLIRSKKPGKEPLRMIMKIIR
jgi:hypothetical protein